MKLAPTRTDGCRYELLMVRQPRRVGDDGRLPRSSQPRRRQPGFKCGRSLSACGGTRNLKNNIPQRLKPRSFWATYGTTKVVPLQSLTFTTGCYELSGTLGSGRATTPQMPLKPSRAEVAHPIHSDRPRSGQPAPTRCHMIFVDVF